MAEGIFISDLVQIILILLIAAFSAVFLKRINFPYTIGLVIIGILLGCLAMNVPAFDSIGKLELDANVIMYIILPTLIFEAAFNIDSRLLIKNVVPVTALAAPGLVISTIIVGAMVAYFTSLSLGAAMLFGALISATDPVAVISLFKELGAPKRLTMLVDGESLFNDATAIVMFNIVKGIIISGASFGLMTVMKGTHEFIVVFFGGIIFGALVGYIMSFLINLESKDPLVQVALSTVAAYATFAFANFYLKISGVMAVLSAGIVLSWFGATRYTPEVKQYLQQFWQYAVFVANSFIFLILGITEWRLLTSVGHSEHLFIYLVWTIFAVVLARAVVVYGIIPLLGYFSRTEESKISGAYQTIIFWGGLRGAVPLALAFSLIGKFENWQLIVELTLGIVLFTLVVQGASVRRLISFFKLDKVPVSDKYSCALALMEAKENSLKTLSILENDADFFDKDVLKQAREYYTEKTESLKLKLLSLEKELNKEPEAKRFLFWEHAISVERQTYQYLFDRNLIAETIWRELTMGADMRKDTVKSGKPLPIFIPAAPLDLQIKIGMARSLNFFFPKAHYVRRLLLKAFEGKYESNIAMAYAGRRVVSFIEKRGSLFGIDASIADECKNFYLKRIESAIKHIKTPKEDIKVIEFAKVAITRSLKNAEITAIEELQKEGGIKENLADELIDHIANRQEDY